MDRIPIAISIRCCPQNDNIGHWEHLSRIFVALRHIIPTKFNPKTANLWGVPNCPHFTSFNWCRTPRVTWPEGKQGLRKWLINLKAPKLADSKNARPFRSGAHACCVAPYSFSNFRTPKGTWKWSPECSKSLALKKSLLSLKPCLVKSISNVIGGSL